MPMKIEVNDWSSFRPGDVIVEPSHGPEGYVVEREMPGMRFGTALVDGETRRGFTTGTGKRFAYPVADGYNVTEGYTEFVEDPDWKAAVDAYARQVDNLRLVVGSTPVGALRQRLEQLLTSASTPPAAVMKPSRIEPKP